MSLKRENALLSKDNETKFVEYASKIQAKDKELNELRISLKMKSFEVTSQGIIFEERMNQLRRKETENSFLTEQVAVLKAAIGKLEYEYGIIKDISDCDYGIFEEEQQEEDLEPSSYEVCNDIMEKSIQVQQLMQAREDLKKIHHIVKQVDMNTTTLSHEKEYLTESVENNREISLRDASDTNNKSFDKSTLLYHEDDGQLKFKKSNVNPIDDAIIHIDDTFVTEGVENDVENEVDVQTTFEHQQAKNAIVKKHWHERSIIL
jgi:hypothetical protein